MQRFLRDVTDTLRRACVCRSTATEPDACAFAYRFTLAGAPVWSRNDGCNGGGGRTSVLHGTSLWVRDGLGDLVLSATDGHVIRPFVSDTPPAFVGTRAVLLPDGTLTAASATTGRPCGRRPATAASTPHR